MSHCRCTGSALDIFIKSIAGLEVRSGRQVVDRRATSAFRPPQHQRTSVRHYSAQLAETQHEDPSSQPPINTTYSASEQSQDTSDATEAFDSVVTSKRQGSKNGNSTPSQPSRTDNRLARKVRRLQGGAWQPLTQAKLRATGKSKPGTEAHAKFIKQQVSFAKNKSVEKKIEPVKRRTAEKRGLVEESIAEDQKSTNDKISEKDRSVQAESSDKERKSAQDRSVNNKESIRHQSVEDEPIQRKRLVVGEDKVIQGILAQVEAEQASLSKDPTDAAAARNKKMQEGQAKADAERLARRVKTRTERPIWQTQKAALKAKFGDEGWKPRKRLSPDSLNGIRALHASDPMIYTTPVLAHHFKITPEAIRRILKSNWRPNEDETEDRRQRWEKRGVIARQEINTLKEKNKNARIIGKILKPRIDPYMNDV